MCMSSQPTGGPLKTDRARFSVLRNFCIPAQEDRIVSERINLGCLLLHNSNINVAIANILLFT